MLKVLKGMPSGTRSETMLFDKLNEKLTNEDWSIGNNAFKKLLNEQEKLENIFREKNGVKRKRVSITQKGSNYLSDLAKSMEKEKVNVGIESKLEEIEDKFAPGVSFRPAPGSYRIAFEKPGYIRVGGSGSIRMGPGSPAYFVTDNTKP